MIWSHCGFQGVPPSSTFLMSNSVGRPGIQWDQIIEQALPPEMLSSHVPRGVRGLLPRFYQMAETDKRTFWAYFFQALAGAEAGLNPNTSVRHTEPEGTMALRSEGLLQLAVCRPQALRLRFQLATGPSVKGERSG